MLSVMKSFGTNREIYHSHNGADSYESMIVYLARKGI